METTDLSNSVWAIVRNAPPSLISDESRWAKPHVCPKSLVPDLIEDLSLRFGPEYDVEGIADIMLDLPGMMYMSRGYQKIKLDTLEIDIPYHDWAVLCSKWKKNPVRTFRSGAQYYKFHTWTICLVLTPEQRDIMVKTMEEFTPYCEKMADEEVEKIVAKNA